MAKDITVRIINAFSIQNRGGNPAGVVFDADDLSQQDKQTIAAMGGFSETAFVSQSAVADFKLEFFTPTKQIPHCGHATIATFTYLYKQGKIRDQNSSKETVDGNRKILFRNGLAFMEQRAPAFIAPEEDVPFILESLGITMPDLQPEARPTICNTGNSFLLVPLKEEALLEHLRINTEMVYSLSAKYNLIGFYVFSRSQKQPEVDGTCRMFGPFYGIQEEAATGMAAGPLACYLYQHNTKKKNHFLIEQGRYMNPSSPSHIHVHLETSHENIERLFVGGDAYVAGEKTISIK